MCSFVVNGVRYKKGIVVDVRGVTEDMVIQALLGDTGKPFKLLMLAALRTVDRLKEGEDF